MNFRRSLASAIIATLSLTALPTFAQTNSKHSETIVIKKVQPDRRDERGDQRDDRQDHRQVSQQDNRAERRDDQRSNQRASNHYYYSARGSDFQRGHRLPSALRSKQYVVTNYQRHQLKKPPRGQQWVQVGADYVLIAVATGLIANVVLSR